jgi:hypothetical protein
MTSGRAGIVFICLGLVGAGCLSSDPAKKDGGTDGTGGSGGNTKDAAPADAPGGSGGSGGADAPPADRMPIDTPPPPPPAEAVNAEFNGIYDTILKVRCSPCHTTQQPRAGMLDMADVGTAFGSLTKESTSCATAIPKERVVPGKPDDSYVIKKLLGAAGICGMRMPRGCVDAPDGGASEDSAVADSAAADAPLALPDASADAEEDGGAPDTRRVRDARADTTPPPPDAGADAGADAAGPPRLCLGPETVGVIRQWIQSGAKVGRLLVNDGLNAANWSLQGNLQVGTGGARPWTDYPNTYIVSVDPPLQGLLGKSWVRLAAASKNFKDGPQATLTLVAPADVYLVVDDRWAANTAWLAGWTDTGSNFVIYENATRPALGFSLYKKTAPAGELALPSIGANNAYDYFIVID